MADLLTSAEPEAPVAPSVVRPPSFVLRPAARWPAIVALGLTALAFALRLVDLGVQSLWLDEALSVVFANRPLVDVIAITVTDDIHPPLYPILLHYWIGLAGKGEFAVRVPSVVFGTLLVPLAYAAGRRLCRVTGEPGSGALPGLAAAALIALSPFLVFFSQEARNYIVVAFFSLLSAYALWRGLHDGRWSWWALYAVATLGSLYSHYNAFFLLAAELVFVFLTSILHWRQVPRFVLALSVTAFVYAPWAGYMVSQLLRIDDYWQGTIDLGSVTFSLLVALGAGARAHWTIALPAVALMLAVFFAGALPLRRRTVGGGLETALFLILLVVIPLAGLYAIIATRPKFSVRYLIVLVPFFYLAVGRGLAALLAGHASVRWRILGHFTTAIGRGVGLALLAGLLLFSAYGVRSVYTDPAYAKDDYRAAVGYIREHWQPNDAIALVIDAYQPIAYYGEGTLTYYGVHSYDEFGWAVERLNEIAAKHDRIWLVLWNPDWADPARYVRHLVEDAGREIPIEREFRGVDVRLFELPTGTRFDLQPRSNRGEPVDFGPVKFLGFNGNAGQPAGSPLRLDLHWLAPRQLDRDYHASISLVDKAGHVWSQVTRPLDYWYYETSKWRFPEVPKHGQVDLPLPPQLAPGTYDLQLKVFDKETGQPLEATATAGRGRIQVVELGPVRVGRPLSPPNPELLAVGQRVALDFGPVGSPELRVVGYDLVTGRIEAGKSLPVTLTWQVLRAPSADHRLALALLDERGAPVADQELPPPSGYRAAGWLEGDVLAGKYGLVIPPDLPTGAYTLAVGWRAPGGRLLPTATPNGFAPLTSIGVTARTARYAAPAPQYPVNRVFGDAITLLGFDLSADAARPGENVKVTLYWKAGLAAPAAHPSSATEGAGPTASPQPSPTVAADRGSNATRAPTVTGVPEGQPPSVILPRPDDGRRTEDGGRGSPADSRPSSVVRRPSKSYKVFVHLVDESYRFAGQHDGVPAGGQLPTTAWLPNEIVVDPHEIPVTSLPAGPGRYRLLVGLYDPVTNERLSLADVEEDTLFLRTIDLAPR